MRWLTGIFLILYPFSLYAATYTATWCPVKGATWYETCIESSIPSSDKCTGSYDFVYNDTTYDFTLPDTATAWFRVRAGLQLQNLFLYSKTGFSAYSNPIQIIGGLTPPKIGGCI